MSRIATLRTPCKLFVAVAFLASAASLEGVSFAANDGGALARAERDAGARCSLDDK